MQSQDGAGCSRIRVLKVLLPEQPRGCVCGEQSIAPGCVRVCVREEEPLSSGSRLQMHSEVCLCASCWKAGNRIVLNKTHTRRSEKTALTALAVTLVGVAEAQGSGMWVVCDFSSGPVVLLRKGKSLLLDVTRCSPRSVCCRAVTESLQHGATTVGVQPKAPSCVPQQCRCWKISAFPLLPQRFRPFA